MCDPNQPIILSAPSYRVQFYLTGALLSGVNAAIFWFSLMWFVSGSGLTQMWLGAHLVTFIIGFTLSLGISLVQAEHISEVIYRASQLGSKALFLIPISTGFRAITDSLLPSSPLAIRDIELSSVDVFTYATASAMVLFAILTLLSWMAEKRE